MDFGAGRIRSRTIRFASSALAARMAVIPLASRAAATRVTRAASATVANRRLSKSTSACSSVVMIVLPQRLDILATASTLLTECK